MTATVAVLGTRYRDFSAEREELGPGATIVAGEGGDADDIVSVAGEATVIIAGSRPRFSREVIQRLPGCRAIVRSGIGVDSIDLEAAAANGMWVVNIPEYGTEAVAQHTLAMTLAATRKLIGADDAVRRGEWGLDGIRPLHLPATSTAGVVGAGRIGTRVAQLFVSVGFGRVLAHDPLGIGEIEGVAGSSLDDLLERSDVVTLHAPGRPGDEPLIGRRELDLMKPGSVLVNTARGSLIDFAALRSALERGAPGLAALDVHQMEPPNLDLYAGVGDQLILTPHMAWYTVETEAELRRRSAREARRVLDGLEPSHAVVTPKEAR